MTFLFKLVDFQVPDLIVFEGDVLLLMMEEIWRSLPGMFLKPWSNSWMNYLLTGAGSLPTVVLRDISEKFELKKSSTNKNK